MSRNEALQWLVKSISRWPTAEEVVHNKIPKPSAGNWCVSLSEVILMFSACEVITQSEWLTAVDHAKVINPNASDEEYKPFRSIEDAQQQRVECNLPVDDVPVHSFEEAKKRADNYSSLSKVLRRAYDQASDGKGSERHGQDLPFTEQPMQLIQDLVGEGFALGQAMKKMQESQRLPHDAAIRELLGAINYIAGAIIHKERHYD